jgi:ABC-type sugar transport system substrate-binding protein
MEESGSTARNRRIAMLIDGDNAQPSLISNMLAEASKYGLVIIRRIYGDWTTANMNGWKETLQSYAIQPIQQFRYTIGKNATDSAMIIDAMDVLYEKGVDGFCLVSSDSDYTRLATRIREKGIFVMGIGKKNTPRAFVNACDVFVFAENLVSETTSPQKQSGAKKANGSSSVQNSHRLLQSQCRC